ncbi:hypothetical protein Pmar_PMAR022060 [Perkinsus marinus ATCC 50983]|uniref:Uncharacterized protein n=1 Tax=Perkinsus marinus (strain ATCC 50983 / TXsc) TaxID=423536 RepID=C5KKT6_PERM5|nr:hypothetical protein Pmar_PMAR022060 [Perkinsus marinus ATCC 50983]EER14897.1 hypothetical protein Pmar_PMAR022060 [Perkinsus marinus ATCC 50983]|eukprot:XP_002783101.1 hypothetical protein Pmar_PMAR022060 [Perkinsus marinus ATCC 50983]
MTRTISRDRPYSPARYLTTVRWVHDSVVAELMSENQGPPVSTLSGSDRTLAALQLGRRAALESRRYVVNCLVHAKPQKVLSHQADDTLPWAIQRLETFDQYCDDECTKEAREADIRKLESLQHKPRGGSNNSALEVDPQSPSGQVANLYYQLTEATENGKVVAKVPEWARKMIRSKVTVDSVELAAFELMCLCMMEKLSESGSSGSEDSESDSDEVGTIPKAIEDRIWFLLERKCGQLSSRQGQLWERVHLASLAACAIALCVRCFMSNSSEASEGDTREVISPVIAKPPPERVLLYGGRAVVAEDEMVEVARVADGAVVRESVRRRILEEPYEHLLLLEDLEYALHGDKVSSEGQPDQLSVAAAKAAAAVASPQNLPGWPGIADEGGEGKLLSPANLSIESEGKYCDFILVHGASALVSENTIKEVLEELPPVQEATLGYFLQGRGIIPDEPLDESMLQTLIDEAESDGSAGEAQRLGQDFKMTLSESYRACGVCGSDCEGSSFKCVDCGVCLHEACRTLLGWNNRNTDKGHCLACSQEASNRPKCSLCPCDAARRSVLVPMMEGSGSAERWCHLLCGLSISGVSMTKDSQGYLRVILSGPSIRRGYHSRLTAEEQIDASRIKCQVDVDASRDQTTTVGDTGEVSAPAELSQVENVPNNIDKGSLGLDDIALVQCDHCHRRRFVNNATAQWVAHLSDFSCSMLEGSQCTADDDWPLALSPSTAPSRTAEAARPSVRAAGQKRNRSKSREAQLDVETPILSASSVANKKRKTTPRSRPKVVSHAENVEARDAAEIAGIGEANETVKSEIPVRADPFINCLRMQPQAPKETTNEIEKDKQPRRRNRRSVEAGTQALFLSLLTPIIQHSASVLLLAQDAPPKSHKEVLAIPDSCFEEEVAVTDLLELLRKSDISSLRFVKFPAGDCRFVRVFNQDHMESFVDILAKFHNITHVDFGGIATTAAGSELQTWSVLI